MRDASASVELEILRIPAGLPFFSSELRRYGGATTVRCVLDRMQALGLVVRVDFGLYVRPRRDEQGAPTLPSLAALLEAVARVDGCTVRACALTEDTATVLTSGRRRTVHLGTTTVRLIRADIASLGATATH